jgi:hypothetical protein
MALAAPSPAAQTRELFSLVRPRATACALGAREREAATQAVHQAAAAAGSLRDAAQFVRAALCRASRDASWCVVAAQSLYVRAKTKPGSAATFAVPALAAALAALPPGAPRAAAARRSGAAAPLPFSLLIFRAGSDLDEGAPPPPPPAPPPPLAAPRGAVVVRAAGARGAAPVSGARLLRVIGGLQTAVTGLDARSEGAFCSALRDELARAGGAAACTWHVILAQARHAEPPPPPGAAGGDIELAALAALARSPAHEACFAVCFDDLPRAAADVAPAATGGDGDGDGDEDVRYLELTLRSCAPPPTLPATDDAGAAAAQPAVAAAATLAPGTPAFYHLVVFRTSRAYLAALARKEDEDWLDAAPAPAIAFADAAAARGGKPSAADAAAAALRRRRGKDDAAAAPPAPAPSAEAAAAAAAAAAEAAFRRRFDVCAWMRDFHAVDAAMAHFRLGAWVVSGLCLLAYVVFFSVPEAAPVLTLAAGRATCPGAPPLAAAALLACARRGGEIAWLAALAALVAWALPPPLRALTGARHALPADTAALLPALWPPGAPPPALRADFCAGVAPLAGAHLSDVFSAGAGAGAGAGARACTHADELLAELHAGQKTGLTYAAFGAFFLAAGTTWLRKRAFLSWIKAVLKGVHTDMRTARERAGKAA